MRLIEYYVVNQNKTSLCACVDFGTSVKPYQTVTFCRSYLVFKDGRSFHMKLHV